MGATVSTNSPGLLSLNRAALNAAEHGPPRAPPREAAVGERPAAPGGSRQSPLQPSGLGICLRYPPARGCTGLEGTEESILQTVCSLLNLL